MLDILLEGVLFLPHQNEMLNSGGWLTLEKDK